MTGRVTVMGIGGSYYILCIYIFGDQGFILERGIPLWRIGEIRPDAFPRLKNDGSSVLVPFFSPHPSASRGALCSTLYPDREEKRHFSTSGRDLLNGNVSHADGTHYAGPPTCTYSSVPTDGIPLQSSIYTSFALQAEPNGRFTRTSPPREIGWWEKCFDLN